MKSTIYFKGKVGFSFHKKGSGRLLIGDHPRVRPLKDLEINPDPLLTAFLPAASGVLDDHFESWFLSEPKLPLVAPEGMESVVNLGESQQWLAPPQPISDEAYVQSKGASR